jgi:hypothetical protein
VLVIGSSFSEGAGLDESDATAGQDKLTHRYSTKVEQQLKQAAASKRFEIVNLAVGGCMSDCWKTYYTR